MKYPKIPLQDDMAIRYLFERSIMTPEQLVDPVRASHAMTQTLCHVASKHPALTRYRSHYPAYNLRQSERLCKAMEKGLPLRQRLKVPSEMPQPLSEKMFEFDVEIDPSNGLAIWQHFYLARLLSMRCELLETIYDHLRIYCRFAPAWERPIFYLINSTGAFRDDLSQAARFDFKRLVRSENPDDDTGRGIYDWI